LNINSLKIPYLVYFSFVLISATWVLLIILAPFFYSQGGSLAELGSFIYLFFSKTCHQIDSRSFSIFGYKLAVCSRCASVYLGFILSVLIYPVFKKLNNEKLPSIWFLIIPVVLLAADSLFDVFDFIKNSFWTRSITGFIIGFVLPFFLIPGFVNFIYQVNNVFKKNNKS